jgi:hypothetical protein
MAGAFLRLGCSCRICSIVDVINRLDEAGLTGGRNRHRGDTSVV